VICPKKGCSGTIYRFRPKHHVTACCRAGSGIVLELEERLWIQAGLICDQCGYMEFYTQNPEQVLGHPGRFFESTEPEN
jgi:hypothetical protein